MKDSTSPKRETKLNFLGMHQAASTKAWIDMRSKLLGNLLTIFVIGLILSLPSTLYLIVKNIQVVMAQWQHPTQITLYVDKNESPKAISNFSIQLQGWPEIDKTQIVTPAQGLSEFKAQAGLDNILQLIGNNPLPYAIILTPSQDWQEVNKAQNIVDRLKKEPLVNDIRLDSDWLKRLEATQSLILNLGLFLGVLTLLATFLIIGNTIRLQVLSHKKEIQVMKLVGATDGFILRPYLYMGSIYGLLGSLVAMGVISVMVAFLSHAVSHLAMLYANSFQLQGLQWDDGLLLIITSSFIGWCAARLSSLRHLKEFEPD